MLSVADACSPCVSEHSRFSAQPNSQVETVCWTAQSQLEGEDAAEAPQQGLALALQGMVQGSLALVNNLSVSATGPAHKLEKLINRNRFCDAPMSIREVLHNSFTADCKVGSPEAVCNLRPARPRLNPRVDASSNQLPGSEASSSANVCNMSMCGPYETPPTSTRRMLVQQGVGKQQHQQTQALERE